MAITLQAAQTILQELSGFIEAGHGNDIASPDMHAKLGLQSEQEFTYGELYAYVLYLIEALLAEENSLKMNKEIDEAEARESWFSLNMQEKLGWVERAECHFNSSQVEQGKDEIEGFENAKQRHTFKKKTGLSGRPK